MNKLKACKKITDPKIYLCNSIGVSFAFPEPEIFRTYSYLLQKGYKTYIENLRLNIFLRIKEALKGEISKKISQRPAVLKLKKRVIFEETNGIIEDYLHIACKSIYAECAEALNFDCDKNLLETVRNIIWEEFKLWMLKISTIKPDIICFFITPRKVREATKESFRHAEFEYLFPLLMIDELKKRSDARYLLACRLSGDSILSMYRNLNHPFNLDMIIYNNLCENFETITKCLREAKSFPADIPGSILRDNGYKTLKKNNPVYPHKMNYTIPNYPADELRKYSAAFSSGFSLQVDGSSGCPLKCSFCSVEYLFGPYRERSAEDLAAEMFYYQNNSIGNFINFNDRIFNADIKRLNKLCEILTEGKYRGAWGIYAAVRAEMNADLFKKMRKAGCRVITFGVESGSDGVLKKMNKNYTSKLAARAIKDSHKSGISVDLEIMTDFPGEAEEDFNQTLRFIKKNFNCIYSFRVNQFEIYPGCDVYNNPEKYGLKKEDLFKEFSPSGRLKKIKKFIAELEKKRGKNIKPSESK